MSFDECSLWLRRVSKFRHILCFEWWQRVMLSSWRRYLSSASVADEDEFECRHSLLSSHSRCGLSCWQACEIDDDGVCVAVGCEIFCPSSVLPGNAVRSDQIIHLPSLEKPNSLPSSRVDAMVHIPLLLYLGAKLIVMVLAQEKEPHGGRRRKI
jgi:hypothetical protein